VHDKERLQINAENAEFAQLAQERLVLLCNPTVRPVSPNFFWRRSPAGKIDVIARGAKLPFQNPASRNLILLSQKRCFGSSGLCDVGRNVIQEAAQIVFLPGSEELRNGWPEQNL
jgi:hypothetical protein